MLRGVIHSHLPEATVLLYGSAARGTNEPDSDYDILVLTDETLSSEREDAVEDALYDLELSQGVVISTAFFARERWEAPSCRLTPFRGEVDKDGVIL